MKNQSNEMIYINKVTEHKDGSATIDWGYNEEYCKLVRDYYKKKRCSKKMAKEFFRKTINNTILKEI